MKQIIYLFIILVLVSCGQSKSESISESIYGKNTATVSDTISTNNYNKVQEVLKEEKDSQEDNRKQLLNDYKKARFYNLTDTIAADLMAMGY